MGHSLIRQHGLKLMQMWLLGLALQCCDRVVDRLDNVTSNLSRLLDNESIELLFDKFFQILASSSLMSFVALLILGAPANTLPSKTSRHSAAIFSIAAPFFSNPLVSAAQGQRVSYYNDKYSQGGGLDRLIRSAHPLQPYGDEFELQPFGDIHIQLS